jgi:F0F1-type ATP synthase membrane subunit b/b'
MKGTVLIHYDGELANLGEKYRQERKKSEKTYTMITDIIQKDTEKARKNIEKALEEYTKSYEKALERKDVKRYRKEWEEQRQKVQSIVQQTFEIYKRELETIRKQGHLSSNEKKEQEKRLIHQLSKHFLTEEEYKMFKEMIENDKNVMITYVSPFLF